MCQEKWHTYLYTQTYRHMHVSTKMAYALLHTNIQAHACVNKNGTHISTHKHTGTCMCQQKWHTYFYTQTSRHMHVSTKWHTYLYTQTYRHMHVSREMAHTFIHTNIQAHACVNKNGIRTSTYKHTGTCMCQQKWHTHLYTQTYRHMRVATEMAHIFLHTNIQAHACVNKNGIRTSTYKHTGTCMCQQKWHTYFYTQTSRHMHVSTKWHTYLYTQTYRHMHVSREMAHTFIHTNIQAHACVNKNGIRTSTYKHTGTCMCQQKWHTHLCTQTYRHMRVATEMAHIFLHTNIQAHACVKRNGTHIYTYKHTGIFMNVHLDCDSVEITELVCVCLVAPEIISRLVRIAYISEIPASFQHVHPCEKVIGFF